MSGMSHVRRVLSSSETYHTDLKKVLLLSPTMYHPVRKFQLGIPDLKDVPGNIFVALVRPYYGYG
jgi:hypothetical protein